MYHAIPFWFVEFLLRNQLINSWEFPYMLFVIFPLLLLIFYLCLWFLSVWLLGVSQCGPPWVYPAWNSLYLRSLADYFLSDVREIFSYYLFKYLFSGRISLFSSRIPVTQMLACPRGLLGCLHFFFSFFFPYSVWQQWFPLSLPGYLSNLLPYSAIDSF